MNTEPKINKYIDVNDLINSKFNKVGLMICNRSIGFEEPSIYKGSLIHWRNEIREAMTVNPVDTEYTDDHLDRITDLMKFMDTEGVDYISCDEYYEG